LREISTLASWTVSTSKPGCGVAALRSPSTDTFWQSDGPQPHTVSLHFFKQVAIVALRVYLDFEADESYTPTRMQFLAGTGPHDLQEWAEMRFEQPKGWIDVDFEGEDERVKAQRYWDRRPALRAFLLQVRILDNHQNGKDTHMRGLQVYARD
ncbi:galactose-binding like protein, partial [Viridothelium virens]